jgi:hypothetical protein
MADSNAPLHGSEPPKPSIFPVLALLGLAAGAFLANAGKPGAGWSGRWLAGLAGTILCLFVFRLGVRLLKSRRAGFFAGLLTACGAVLWRAVPLKLGLTLLPAAAIPALALGWVLDRFSEGRLGRAATLAVRAALLVSGLLLAASMIMMEIRSAPGVVPVACFAVAGLLVAVMSLAGKGRPWPVVEAALVAAVALVTWLGLALPGSGG